MFDKCSIIPKLGEIYANDLFNSNIFDNAGHNLVLCECMRALINSNTNYIL